MNMNKNNEGLTIQIMKESKLTQKQIESILLESNTISRILKIPVESTLTERMMAIINLVQDCQKDNKNTSFKKQVLSQLIYLIMEKSSVVTIKGNKLVKIYFVSYESLLNYFDIPEDLLTLNEEKQRELEYVLRHLNHIKDYYKFEEIFKEYMNLKKTYPNTNTIKLIRKNKSEFKHIIELETELSKIINLMKKSYVNSQPVSNKLISKVLGIPQHTVLSLTTDIKNKYVKYINTLLDEI